MSRGSRARVIGLVAAMSCFWATAGVADWPHIRGPHYDGHASWTNLSLPWAAEGPPVLWSATVGQGYSGFVVTGQRIFTQGQTRAGQFVICLDLSTGRELWRTRYGWPWQNDGTWPGPYASPTADPASGRVYFAGCYGEVGCVRADDGALLWSVNLATDAGCEMPGFGYACTPLLEEGRIYLPGAGPGRGALALDAATGRVIWISGDNMAAYSSCLPINVDGQRQILTLHQNVGVARDPRTGAQLWRFPWSEGYDPHCTWPLYEEPYLFWASPFRAGARVVRPGDHAGRRPPVLVWEGNVMSHDILSGVVIDGFVYGFDVHDAQANPDGITKGVFKCVDLATGAERWQSKAPGHASVLACGDRLLLFGESGTLVVAEATPAGYRELGRSEVFPGGTCWTAPALCDGYLLLRRQEEAVCLWLGSTPSIVRSVRPDAVPSSGRRVGIVPRWLDRHQSPSYWDPSLQDQGAWFVACVALLGLAWFAAQLGWQRQTRAWAFTALAAMFGIAGTPLLTSWTGRFIFSVPVLLFALFGAALQAISRAHLTGGRRAIFAARAALIGFAAACAACAWLCQHWFLMVGLCFLVGFTPAAPLAYVLAKRLDRQGLNGTTAMLAAVSFTVYFWTSMLFNTWKSGL